ncbi:hypothetical protein LK436_15440 [Clostridium sp. M62/1]|uniref:hypothetical protein n=1 Tax=Clostridium sp. M62/1 TaxID=411486 RepID=UPI0001973D6E|nr:hypothetical protein [Clostridium sp. M62/1]EFE13919.1 hypothetical protein CLOM621_05805 [Clostridium sp. M62/1]UEB78272.1 hypothetical protein LK436_15440 [Clostridium sp. M62/1]
MREEKERPKALRQAKNRYGHEKPEKTGPVRTGQAGEKDNAGIAGRDSQKRG